MNLADVVQVLEGELLCTMCARLRNDPTWLLSVLATTAPGASDVKSAESVDQSVQAFLELNELDLDGHRMAALGLVQECVAAVHSLRMLQKPFAHARVLLPAAATAASSDDDDDDGDGKEIVVSVDAELGEPVVRQLFARILKKQRDAGKASTKKQKVKQGNAPGKRRRGDSERSSVSDAGENYGGDAMTAGEKKKKRRKSMPASAVAAQASGSAKKTATAAGSKKGRRKSSAV